MRFEIQFFADPGRIYPSKFFVESASDKNSYNVDEEFRKYCEKIQYDDKLITDDMFSNDDLCLEDPFSLNKNLDSWEEKHVNLNECSGQEDEEINGRI